jgi:cell division protein FtsQ
VRALGGQRRAGARGGASPAAPSRWARRAQRLWRRRGFRRAVTLHGPALALAGLVAVAAYSPAAQDAVAQRLGAVVDRLTQRPEFAIRDIRIDGAAPMLEAEIRAALIDVMGASSLALDAAAVQRRVESLGWVARARVALAAPVGLRVSVEQRRAAAVWRVDGEPFLVDAGGAVIEPAFSRADHPDLPLIAGRGAERAVDEALAVLASAGPLGSRIRGLVRVGERRWDVMLAGPAPGETMTLKLPHDHAVAAMAQAVGAQAGGRLFDRDLAVVDLRLPGRPTVRLTERAHDMLEAALDEGDDA